MYRVAKGPCSMVCMKLALGEEDAPVRPMTGLQNHQPRRVRLSPSSAVIKIVKNGSFSVSRLLCCRDRVGHGGRL